MLNIGVLVSGGGTNLQALIDAQNGGIIKSGTIVTVVSDREGAYALERAAKAGIDGHSILKKDYAEKADFDKALVEYLNLKMLTLWCLPGSYLIGQGFYIGVPRQDCQHTSVTYPVILRRWVLRT